MNERDPARKDEAGKDLVRTIFGANAMPTIRFSNLLLSQLPLLAAQ